MLQSVGVCVCLPIILSVKGPPSPTKKRYVVVFKNICNNVPLGAFWVLMLSISNKERKRYKHGGTSPFIQ